MIQGNKEKDSYYSQKTTSGILGNTIEEKTRAILGWTADVGQGFGVNRSIDIPGPDRIKKRKPSSNSSYPYDLLNGASPSSRNSHESCSRSSTSRKSSSASLNSLSSSTAAVNEFSSLFLSSSNELTPPPSPSPIFKNQNGNGVTVITLPRPPPPPYHHQQQFYRSGAEMRLPISPVSPPTSTPTSTGQRIDDESANSSGRGPCNFRVTEIFERLRTQMPHLSTEQSKFRILVQTVANVIELETKLAQLHEETRSLSNILQEKKRQQLFQNKKDLGPNSREDTNQLISPTEKNWTDSTSPDYGSPVFAPLPTPIPAAVEDVPDDLQEIDVTAFRCLVAEQKCDQPNDRLSIDQNNVDHCDRSASSFWQSYYGDVANGIDPQSAAIGPIDFLSFGDYNQASVANPLVVDTMS